MLGEQSNACGGGSVQVCMRAPVHTLDKGRSSAGPALVAWQVQQAGGVCTGCMRR